MSAKASLTAFNGRVAMIVLIYICFVVVMCLFLSWTISGKVLTWIIKRWAFLVIVAIYFSVVAGLIFYLYELAG